MDDSLENKALRKLIGQKVKKLRKRRHLTQVELGMALSMSSSGAISQVENGDKGLKLAKLIRAAEILGVHPAVLISPVDSEDPEDLVVLSKVFELIEKKQHHPEVTQPLLRAISGLLDMPIPQADPPGQMPGNIRSPGKKRRNTRK